MIDPSPTTPVEYLEAQKKRKTELVANLFQRESAKISDALKTSNKRVFDIDAPKDDSSFLPEVERAAGLIKDQFEKAGWEVDCGGGAYWCRLHFNLPGTRARERKVLKITAMTVVLVGALIGGIFAGPSIFHKLMPSSSVTQSDTVLGQLIAKSNFRYVNSHITEENFPDIGVKTDFKVYSFGRYISSEDAIKEMEKDGYKPANLRELITYSQNGWNGTDTVVALGQVWRSPDGNRYVPYVSYWYGERKLYLNYLDFVWYADYRFLAFRKFPAEGGR